MLEKDAVIKRYVSVSLRAIICRGSRDSNDLCGVLTLQSSLRLMNGCEIQLFNEEDGTMEGLRLPSGTVIYSLSDSAEDRLLSINVSVQ
jgi:hypothetical protein